jgi:prepilin-type N-terminal cleavage/methylation domain-containing protein
MAHLDLFKLNNMKNKQKEKNKSLMGFTLIELVVVIAIIGILSAVVLFSVAQYINKSKDVNVMGNLAIFVSSGEVFYNVNQSYEGFCESNVVINAKNEIPKPTPPICAGGICCNDEVDAWAACAQKFFFSDKAYCVDSRGVKIEINASSCNGFLTVCPES